MKGILKSLEAAIALITVLGFVIWYFNLQPAQVDLESVDWRLKGLNALKAVDNRNELRKYILANDTTSLQAELSPYFPSTINYTVIVCTTTCPSVSFTTEKVYSVSYFVAGDFGNITSREVMLYVW
ncbi:hypothetical protein HZB88_03080 [archaeon]|nr:hypothetical protein [archaeon]